MYLEELLPEFRKGAKIRRKSWVDCCYIDKKSIINLTNPETLAADDWELYQDPIDWDYIIKNNCLCSFWDDDEQVNELGVLADHYSDDTYLRSGDCYYPNCRPVRRNEVTFYEDRKDER